MLNTTDVDTAGENYPNIHAALLAMFGNEATRLESWDDFAPRSWGGIGSEPVKRGVLATGVGNFTCGDAPAVMSFAFVREAHRGHMVVTMNRDGRLALCWGS